ncbi:MAG: hypothetical protein QOJ67_4242, partial [Acidimicrobiaceae bacterium]
FGVSLAFNDPRGTLGTDTGGKLATLHMMERHGGLDPDLGYWAEAHDPQGVLQPLHYTYRVGTRWVNVTTLPMLYAAYPLYLAGGARAVLLLPMVGAVLCALAAAALARRLGGGDGRAAFWIIGLATPVAIYALDFWEHTVGLALMLWAAVLVLDVVERRAGWRGACAAGALFGLAATMRTEALVYLVVSVGLACLVMLVRERALVRPLVAGIYALAGAGLMLVLNRLLEQATLGTDLRGSRVAGTATGSGGAMATRVKEAFTTTVGLGFSGMRPSAEWIVGAAVAVMIVAGAWLLTSIDRRRTVVGTVLVVVAGVVYVDRFSQGVGFVPGLLVASPLAAVGIVLAWRAPRLRFPAAVAVAALPIAWLSQFSGGADPQWGARYVLMSGTLLAVAGYVVLRDHRRALVSVLVVAGLVTAGGVAWLSVRSHTVADGMTTILARHDEMLISRQTHMLREGGAFYDIDRKWLTATTAPELRRAVAIAHESGVREFALIGGADQPAPASIDGYVRGGRQLVPFIRPDVKLGVVTYRLAPGA